MAEPDHVTLVALTFEDGSVGIMNFLLDVRCPDPSGIPGMQPDGTRLPTDEAIQWDIDKTNFGQKVVSWRVVKLSEIPTFRAYRGAWRDVGHKIDHDMPHAREIHRSHMRDHRVEQLGALDIEYQKADEKGDAQAKKVIAAKKQKLRDAPADPRIEAAQTAEDLKSLTLDVLAK